MIAAPTDEHTLADTPDEIEPPQGALSRRFEVGSGLSRPEDAITVRTDAPEVGAPSYTPRPIPLVDEERRRARLSHVREAWRARAAALATKNGPTDRRRAAYARSRAEALTRDVTPKLASCGTVAIPIACSCTARCAYELCRQWWLCTKCQDHRRVGLEIRLTKSLEHELELELDAWARAGGRGMKPTIVFLSLTQRHSGELELDRHRLNAGWRGLYKAMHPRWGRFPFVRVWEITPGRCTTCEGYLDDLPSRGAQRSRFDDTASSDEHKARNPCRCERPTPEGHLHMHVAAIWRYRDWDVVRELWLRACPTSEFISIVAKRDDGKPTTPGSTARYLGKYLSKGVNVEAFTPELRADVSAAMYNAHSIDASSGFWQPENHHCRKCDTRIKRIVACEAWVFDTVKANGGDTYWLWRRATLEEQLPAIDQHVYGRGTGPPS